ncbi:leucine-rich repeat-containing protein 23 [Halictus rubicundus]|uniref:leucine-rich repeat-containing protein 23 n=1 Tax=Halictus rubicundus TaxID=77578 RepID=UPI004035118A
MEDDHEEAEGEYEPRYESPEIPEEARVLSFPEAAECLHTLGKCDSGLGYAYLGLNVSNKSLTDIEVILRFKYILFVDVSGNRLTEEDLRVLTKMTYLLMIQADNNRISSAEMEQMPYLQVLTLNKNKLKSTSGISHNLLEILELNHNNIEEVTLNPYDLKNLKTLELRGNMLTTTNGIFFPGLICLYIAENQIEKLEGLEILVNLKILHLRSNKLSILDGFDSRCAKLSYLNLRNNEITKISEIQKLSCLPALETLIIFENPAINYREEDEENMYRQIVLAMLPDLVRIDKDPVLYKEKREAQEFRTQMILNGSKFTDFDVSPAE